LALLFLIPALSLAGIPPLSGFFAKFVVIRAGLEAQAYVVTGIALLVGLLTLYSMIKIWAEVFWKKAPEHVTDVRRLRGEVKDKHNWAYFVPVIGLAACTVFIGLNGQPIYELADMAAHQLLNPQLYIEAVLGAQQ
jgi:multicomponent Na+:H+ antiporter subunit D